MTEAEAHAALHEARLACRAGRALVRELATKLARAEDALELLSNAQPKEAQRDDREDDEGARYAGTDLCAA